MNFNKNGTDTKLQGGKMKVIFMGTPDFAVAALEGLCKAGHNIVAVVSQPDRETDRKGRLLNTPVKEFALKNGLNLYQFEKAGARESIDILSSLKADVIVTCAYGQLLPQAFLDMPIKHKILNIHASILPKYRGSSPIHAAILNGETETGVSIMRTVLKMDAGAVLNIKKTTINDSTDFITLHDKLKNLGAEAIIETLKLLNSGKAVETEQDETKATYTKKITKQDGLLSFKEDAKKIIRKINAFNPWPAAYIFYNDDNLKIYKAEICHGDVDVDMRFQTGEVVKSDGELIIKAKDGFIKILNIQAPGKKAIETAEFLRGYKINVGYIFE